MLLKKGSYFILIALLLTLFFNHCTEQANSSSSTTADPLFSHEEDYTIFQNKTARSKTFQIHPTIQVVLDSASKIKLLDSLINGRLLMRLDGQAHFTIDRTKHPVIIFTGMLELTTDSVDFKIKAYNSSPGQSLKVFDGQMTATKSYNSNFPATDTLHKEEMILINREIDLMEKETFKPILSISND